MKRSRSVRATLGALGVMGAAAHLSACAATMPVRSGDIARESHLVAPRGDSVRGIIVVVGAEPMTRVVLQTRAGAQMVVTGEALRTLRALDGIEVRCAGQVEGERLRVASFRVVGAHGLPARDGILEFRGDGLVLVGADGVSTRYTPAPAALRDWAGQRIWVAGTPGSAPEAWGLIAPVN